MSFTITKARRHEGAKRAPMTRIISVALWAVIAGAGIGAAARPLAGSDKGVQVTVKEAERRVDVTIDGQPFTAYVWPTSLKKPVLYPIRTAKGTLVTRGFPLDPRPGERVDHPHHVGLWFNYGDVNGIDFWNNSDAIAARTDGPRWAPSFTRRSPSPRAGPARAYSKWTPPG